MTTTEYAGTLPHGASPEILVRDVPERRARWIDWVTTTDHKKIGILYLFTTAFFLLVGGVEALLMRVQLGAPDNTFLDPTTYNMRAPGMSLSRMPLFVWTILVYSYLIIIAIGSFTATLAMLLVDRQF